MTPAGIRQLLRSKKLWISASAALAAAVWGPLLEPYVEPPRIAFFLILFGLLMTTATAGLFFVFVCVYELECGGWCAASTLEKLYAVLLPVLLWVCAVGSKVLLFLGRPDLERTLTLVMLVSLGLVCLLIVPPMLVRDIRQSRRLRRERGGTRSRDLPTDL